VNEEGAKLNQLKNLLVSQSLTEKGTDRPSVFISQKLSKLTRDVLDETIMLPVLGSKQLSADEIYRTLNNLKTMNSGEIAAIRQQVSGYTPFDEVFSGASSDVPLPPPADTRSLGRTLAQTRMEGTRALRQVVKGELDAGFRDLEAGIRKQIRAPAVRVEGGGGEKTLSQMNLSELRARARSMGLSELGTKKDLAASIRATRK
jgi:hypothetical protein